MKLFSLLATRLAAGLFTFVGVTFLIFLSVTFLPGDFATAVLGQSATPETVAALRRTLGTDVSFWTRYFSWLGNALTGDFGYSFSSLTSLSTNSAQTVATQIGDRLLNTIFLAGLTAVFAVPISICLGIISIVYKGKMIDRIITTSSIGFISLPEFLVAYLLVVFLAVKFPIFHALSYVTPGMPLSDRILRCVLPALTMFIPVTAHMARMTRACLVPIMSSPFIETAKLKGTPKWQTIFHHALPNAWAPITAVVALNLAYLIVGVVVVEVVFAYPGIGQLMVDAVSKRDIPVVLACGTVFSVAYVALNTVADMVGILSNPRIRHPSK